jgi:hypothetical protein
MAAMAIDAYKVVDDGILKKDCGGWIVVPFQ